MIKDINVQPFMDRLEQARKDLHESIDLRWYVDRSWDKMREQIFEQGVWVYNTSDYKIK